MRHLCVRNGDDLATSVMFPRVRQATVRRVGAAGPVFQIQELYRYGEVDSCQGKWGALYDCLKKRTKFADQVPPPPPRACHSRSRLRASMAAFRWQALRRFARASTTASSAYPPSLLGVQVVDKPKPTIWQLRTPEEASAWWKVCRASLVH